MDEDQPDDAEIAARELRKAGIAVLIRRVQSPQDMIRELDAFKADLILSDFRLPNFSGLHALDIAKRRLPHKPFVFFSGTHDAVVEALERGANAYVLKEDRAQLPDAIKRVLHMGTGTSGN